MSADPANSSKLAFSSRCLPGSVAEQKEKERLAEFQRNKSLQKAEEEQSRPQRVAQREEAYLAASQANKERMHRRRMTTYHAER